MASRNREGPSPSEYRNRLKATQQRRRSRCGTTTTTTTISTGSVDDTVVDDFAVPPPEKESSSSPVEKVLLYAANSKRSDGSSIRRSNTPTPVVSKRRERASAGAVGGETNNERRTKSAPRPVQRLTPLAAECFQRQDSSNPKSKNKPVWRNGDTVFCFQPGRCTSSADDDPSPPSPSPPGRRSSNKTSLSKLQHELQQQQHEPSGRPGSRTRPRPFIDSKGKPAPILRQPSFLTVDEDDMIDKRISKVIRVGNKPRSASLPKQHSLNPRQQQHYYSACSSTTKLWSSSHPTPGKKSSSASSPTTTGAGNTNTTKDDSRSTQDADDDDDSPSVRGCVRTSMRTGRSVSQQITDCLLLAADLCQLELGDLVSNGNTGTTSSKKKAGKKDRRSGKQPDKNNNSVFFMDDPAEETASGTLDTDEITDDVDGTIPSSEGGIDTTTNSSLFGASGSCRSGKQHRPTERRKEAQTRGRERCRDNNTTLSDTSSCSRSEDADANAEGKETTQKRGRQRNRESDIARSDSSSSDTRNEDVDENNLLRPPQILNLTRQIVATTSPTSVVIQVNPDDFEVPYSKSKERTRSPETDDDINTEYAQGPLLPSVLWRDLQRRPRGTFENTVSDDDATRHSKPYDEPPSSKKGPLLKSSSGSAVPDPSSMRDLRLDLYRRGGDDDRVKRDEVAAKYARALQDIEKQEKSLKSLQKQLVNSALLLEGAKRDLHLSKVESAKRSQLFEETTSTIFRERIEIDERLRIELQANQCLNDEVADLRKEVASLAVALERAQERKDRPDSQQPFVSESTTTSCAYAVGSAALKSDPEAMIADAYVEKDVVVVDDPGDASGSVEVRNVKAHELLLAELLTLRSDVVDLRAQLAEERATNLSAGQEMAQLERDRDEAQRQASCLAHELDTVKKEAEEMRSTADSSHKTDAHETTRLKEELCSLRKELALSNEQAAAYSAKSKRLEQELADAAKYEFQASNLDKQLQKAVAEANDMALVSDSEARRIQTELKQMKEKLSQTNSEIIRQAAVHFKERKRMEEELEQTQQVAQILQHKVASMDGLMAAAESDALQHTRQEEEEQDDKTGNWGSSVLMDILRKRLDPK